MQMQRYAWLAALLLVSAYADVYLHIPRGGNNRLNEKSANRANANRVFDSQNNNRGGYNVGDKDAGAAGDTQSKQYLMKYFMSSSPDEGQSYMDIEWTNQHACGGHEDGDPHKVNCNLVLQYMCQPNNLNANDENLIRSGTNTGTNQYNKPNQNKLKTENLRQKNARKNVDTNRGVQEPWEWYDKCYNRERNQGLFTADQKLKKSGGQQFSSAIHTRQNPNGNRYGYECPEERDYFPYWAPTPWRDIAVLTDNMTMCDYYKENSFNTKPYGECIQTYPNSNRRKHYHQANNPEQCTELGGTWTEFYNYVEISASVNNRGACTRKSRPGMTYVWGVPVDTYDTGNLDPQCLLQPAEIDCQQAPWSRSNHLGNGRDGIANTYRWQLPYMASGEEQRCIFRMRYNISTDDYDPWRTNSSFNQDLIKGVQSPVQQNPYVNVGADTTALRLAINTAQFGRTFQDRSHPFILMARENKIKSQTIHNLNVRGKRGNIVQVYPAVEYDFAPNTLVMEEGDLVHIQWTGSNTHNNGNPGGDGQTGDAGQGRAGTDRSNIAEFNALYDNYPTPFENTTVWSNSDIMWVYYKINNNKLPNKEDLAVNMVSSGYYRCMKSADCGVWSVEQKDALNKLLDNAPASYEGAVLQIKKGKYHYMCTRNNNFTNRSQKGTITVT